MVLAALVRIQYPPPWWHKPNRLRHRTVNPVKWVQVPHVTPKPLSPSGRWDYADNVVALSSTLKRGTMSVVGAYVGVSRPPGSMGLACHIATGNKAPEPSGCRQWSYKPLQSGSTPDGATSRIRLLDRTRDFQSLRRGSIPLCGTKDHSPSGKGTTFTPWHT